MAVICSAASLGMASSKFSCDSVAHDTAFGRPVPAAQDRFMIQRGLWLLTLAAVALGAGQVTAADDDAELSKLKTDVLNHDQRSEASSMLERYIRRRTDEFNLRNREA